MLKNKKQHLKTVMTVLMRLLVLAIRYNTIQYGVFNMQSKTDG